MRLPQPSPDRPTDAMRGWVDHREVLLSSSGTNGAVTRRLATFPEANAWVHLSPEWFARFFPSLRSVWQAEDGRVWVEADQVRGLDS